MLRRLVVFVTFLVAAPAMAFNAGPARERVITRLEAGDNRALATETMDKMLDVAGKEMRRLGYSDDADKLGQEWDSHYRGVMLGLLSDVGDHKPLFDWIAKWYPVIAAELGDNFMELSHLKDIWLLNATIPVIFKPHAEADWCVEQLANHPGDTCEAEYRRHMAGTKYFGLDAYATDFYEHHGLAGVVTYWIVYAACEAATYGSGAFVLCSPIGSISEILVEKFAAPQISNSIWEKENP